MELKSLVEFFTLCALFSSNRTFMELKYYSAGGRGGGIKF